MEPIWLQTVFLQAIMTAVNDDNNQGRGPSSSSVCQGQADCFTGMITEIVDGDTLDVNNVRVRLSLDKLPN
jgi:endonuclease YncB( thermonuclease family)